MTDMEGPRSLVVMLSRNVVLGGGRKQAGGAMSSVLPDSAPPWSLLQFLTSLDDLV